MEDRCLVELLVCIMYLLLGFGKWGKVMESRGRMFACINSVSSVNAFVPIIKNVSNIELV